MALRSKDAMDDKMWKENPSSKKSADSSIGSKAKNALAAFVDDPGSIQKAYQKVLVVLDGLTEEEQKACLLATVSDYTLESLLKRAKESPPRRGGLSARDAETVEFTRKTSGEEAAQKMLAFLLEQRRERTKKILAGRSKSRAGGSK